MPTPAFRVRHVLPALLAGSLLVSSLAFATEAQAKTKTAGIRVVDSAGTELAQGKQYAGPASIKTSKKADCFGPGTGGSGAKVAIPGTTAMGQLAAAPISFPKTDPLGITDAFDFGLGICGIGKAVAPPIGFWYLKVNHVGSMTGAEDTKLGKGDEALWYLIADYNDPTPDELVLKAPKRADAGKPVTVTVLSYGDDGTKSPAAGAVVGGAAPTDASGKTDVELGGGVTKLRATREGSIPSNSVAICTERPAKCPAGYATTVGGTAKADAIVGSGAAETINAGPGNDKINATKGKARDKINCGPGKDKLILSRGSTSKYRACEKVKIK